MNRVNATLQWNDSFFVHFPTRPSFSLRAIRSLRRKTVSTGKRCFCKCKTAVEVARATFCSWVRLLRDELSGMNLGRGEARDGFLLEGLNIFDEWLGPRKEHLGSEA